MAILVTLSFIMLVSGTVISEEPNSDPWLIELLTTIDHPQGGTDNCYIGEYSLASDDIDQYDVPKYPLQPPDRTFIWSYREDFEEPYNNLWYEYREYPNDYQEWIIYTYYYNAYCPGTVDTTIEWDKDYLANNTEYDNMMLYHYLHPPLDGLQAKIDMMDCDEYTFEIDAYQLEKFSISAWPD